MLGKTVYGEFVVFLMITQLVGTCSNLGLSTYLVKLIGGKDSSETTQLRRFVKKVNILSCVVSGVVTLGIYLLLEFLLPSYLPDLPLWVFILGACAYSLMVLFVEYYRALKWIMLSTTIAYLIAPTIALLLLWLLRVPAENTLYLVYCWLAGIALVFLIGLLVRAFIPVQFGSDESINLRKSLLYSSPYLLATLLVYCNEWVDKMILNAYVSNDLLGEYHLAFRLATFISLPLMAFNTLLAPQIAKFFEQKQYIQLRSSVFKIVKWSSFLAVLGIIILIVLGKPLLTLFEPDYVDSYSILILLGIGQLVNVIAGPVGVVMKMTDQHGTYAKILGVSVVLNAIMSLILVPTLGLFGAAISFVLSLIFVNCLGWYLCLKRSNINTSIITTNH